MVSTITSEIQNKEKYIHQQLKITPSNHANIILISDHVCLEAKAIVYKAGKCKCLWSLRRLQLHAWAATMQTQNQLAINISRISLLSMGSKSIIRSGSTMRVGWFGWSVPIMTSWRSSLFSKNSELLKLGAKLSSFSITISAWARKTIMGVRHVSKTRRTELRGRDYLPCSATVNLLTASRMFMFVCLFDFRYIFNVLKELKLSCLY